MFDTDIIKEIYVAVSDLLLGATELNYFKTRQRGFYPRGDNLVSPTLYPYLFVEYGQTSEVTAVRVPKVWQYTHTIPVVVMTLADLGNFEDLVYNIGQKNRNKGIGEIVYDVKQILWQHHDGNFGIQEIHEWNISAVHTPNVLAVQRLLMSEFVRGLQIDLTFEIWESG